MKPNKLAHKYWQIIRWDPTSFLTLHDNRNSRIFYEKICPGVIENIVFGLRGLLGGMLRLFQSALRSFQEPYHQEVMCQKAYLLLITLGSEKYSHEEREILKACSQKGIDILTVYPSCSGISSENTKAVTIDSYLSAADYLNVMSNWLREIFRGLCFFFSRDVKKQRLFIASIPTIRVYYSFFAFASRIAKRRGMPQMVLSLLPGSAISVAIVEYFGRIGVLTAGIRTQATGPELEHMAVNTEILFYKSLYEKWVYAEIFHGNGPRLEPACLLSLPQNHGVEAPFGKQEYALLLGTCPGTGQDYESYSRYIEKLFKLGKASGLRVIFKQHNLNKGYDERWFGNDGAAYADCLKIGDMGYNRWLIDHAAMVISAPSTLLYYAILKEKPIVLVLNDYSNPVISDEFEEAPIVRITSELGMSTNCLNWNEVTGCVQDTISWFNRNYFLQNGANFIIDVLQREIAGRSHTKANVFI